MPLEFRTAGSCPTPATATAKRPFVVGNVGSFCLQHVVEGSLSIGRIRGGWKAPSNAGTKGKRSKEKHSFRVHKIVGDGRCMFRATVRALAMNKGKYLRTEDEQQEAEQLRQACHDALCRTRQRSRQFPDARKQILFGYGDLTSYCQQLARPTFWGGEVEMMVISSMLQVPIVVYESMSEKTGGKENGFCELAKFGSQYEKLQKGQTPRAVKLLYTGGNHFDLLV